MTADLVKATFDSKPVIIVPVDKHKTLLKVMDPTVHQIGHGERNGEGDDSMNNLMNDLNNQKGREAKI